MSISTRLDGFERHRGIAIALLCALLALAGVANAEIGHRQSSPATLNPNISSAELTNGATSSAWYCAGPLPVGRRPQNASIAIANASARSTTGKMMIANLDGVTTEEAINVAGHAQAVLNLPRVGAASFAAVTVVVNDAGIGVSEVIHSPVGVSQSTCVTHTGQSGYLASGGTKDPANVTLSIYDPSSTPAVASVTFATSAGLIAPPVFQGLSVLAGQIIMLNVGHYVLARELVASIVHTEGGRVAVGAMETVAFQKSVASSLTVATLQPARRWYFAGAPAGSAARQSFYVLNPGRRPARVTTRFASTSGAAKVAMVVAPGAIAVFSPAPDPAPSALRWAVITTGSTTPVVVSRTTTLATPVPGTNAATATSTSPSSKSAGAKKKVPPVSVTSRLLPALAPGFAVSDATSALSKRWLLPGGEVSPSASEVIIVTNPTDRSTEVWLRSLSPTKGIDLSTRFDVGANSSVGIAVDSYVALGYSIPLLVDATMAVIVGSLVYARGSSGALGFSAPVAIPVD